MLTFRLTTTAQIDRAPRTQLSGTDDYMYLGCVPVDGDITAALREFSLPTAVAPGEWPAAHEQVTCDEDPRGGKVPQ